VGHGLYDAGVDLDIIRGWWTAKPEANIGLPTGHAFDVLDIDGEAGWSTIAHAVAKNGCLSSSPVSITGSGGGHDLFLPTGCKNRAGFLPKLDWRGAGGYIIAPPSIHSNGTRYEWALSPDEVPLEAAPPWLVAMVRPPPAANRPAQAQSTQGGANGSYAQAALESEVDRVRLAVEGTRNDQLNRSAHALGQLVGAGLLTIGESGAALLAAAIVVGLGEREAQVTIHSGLSAGIRSPREVRS
jgi:hypothetical protein